MNALFKKAAAFAVLLCVFAFAGFPAFASGADALDPIADVSRGGGVRISGASSLETVIVKVVDPDRLVIFFDVVKASGGAFLVEFTLPESAKEGTYTVSCGSGENVQLRSFRVKGDTVPEESGTSGGSASVPEKSPGLPVTAVASVTATAGSGGTANAAIPEKAVSDAISRAQSDAKAQGKAAGISVELNVSMPQGSASLTATLPQRALDSLISAGAASLTISGSPVTLSFDGRALAEIQRQSGGDVSIAIAPATGLSASAMAVIGDRPAYNLTVSYSGNGGGGTVSGFGGGVAEVSFPYTPGANEAVSGLYAVYVDAQGNAQPVAGSAYDPASGSVIFSAAHFSVYAVGYTAPGARFTDVASHWGLDDIDYIAGRGVLTGTSETTFSPDAAMTRGMLATALGRLAEVDTKAYASSSYSDVKADSVFLPYIEWASREGVMTGVGNGRFEPNRVVTREEIAVILADYAGAVGYTLPVLHEPLAYEDVSLIDSACEDAVKAMQQAGIMTGVGGSRFSPKGNATRAEVSAMLHRYLRLTLDLATAKGWAKNDAGRYLYYRDGMALTGSQTIDGVKYFFETDGSLQTGWVKDGSGWRFYSGSKMLTGFADVASGGGQQTYYFTEDGLMASGRWLQLDGKWYYFNADGTLARNTSVDGYEVDENGVRKQK